MLLQKAFFFKNSIDAFYLSIEKWLFLKKLFSIKTSLLVLIQGRVCSEDLQTIKEKSFFSFVKSFDQRSEFSKLEPVHNHPNCIFYSFEHFSVRNNNKPSFMARVSVADIDELEYSTAELLNKRVGLDCKTCFSSMIVVSINRTLLDRIVFDWCVSIPFCPLI